MIKNNVTVIAPTEKPAGNIRLLAIIDISPAILLNKQLWPTVALHVFLLYNPHLLLQTRLQESPPSSERSKLAAQ